MMKLLYLALGAVVIYFAFSFNILLGIAVVIGIILYGIYHFMPIYYVTVANKAFEMGNEKAACEWYKKAYDTGRAKVDIKSSYAYLLLRTGHADEAERVLDPIIRVRGLAPEKKNLAKQQRCMVYYKQGRLDEAIADAEEIMETGYRNTNLYGMMGYFKLLSNSPIEETLEFCKEAYDYNDEDRDIMDNLSLCYYKLNKYDEAKELSDKIIEQFPEFLEGYYHGAQIAIKLHDYKTAGEYVEKMSECKRSALTTVSEEEAEALAQEVKKYNENTTT